MPSVFQFEVGPIWPHRRSQEVPGGARRLQRAPGSPMMVWAGLAWLGLILAIMMAASFSWREQFVPTSSPPSPHPLPWAAGRLHPRLPILLRGSGSESANFLAHSEFVLRRCSRLGPDIARMGPQKLILRWAVWAQIQPELVPEY